MNTNRKVRRRESADSSPQLTAEASTRPRPTATSRRAFAIVGGSEVRIGTRSSRAALERLARALRAECLRDHADIEPEIEIEVHESIARETSAQGCDGVARKFSLFDAVHQLERSGVDTLLVPCFASHAFIDELKENVSLDVVDMMAGLVEHVRRRHPGARRVGVLTSLHLRSARLFERYFGGPDFAIVHPTDPAEVAQILGAIAAANESPPRASAASDVPLYEARRLFQAAVAKLVASDVDVIVPGLPELLLLADGLAPPFGVPLVDAFRAYAPYAASRRSGGREAAFKLGIVGGIGPAATIDFMHKIVRSTPAARDQDHIKLLVEHNPQIPDRTLHLVGEGADPTLHLYATCKKLVSGGAQLIAIPCNTAHAFVGAIQSRLDVPIVNMLTTTVEHIARVFPNQRTIGLLATSGTIASGVYAREFGRGGLTCLIPTPTSQERVMQAIYGPRGVKAGFTDGECVNHVRAAASELVARGAELLVLGCSELPLLVRAPTFVSNDGRAVPAIDPTEVLARHCVAHAIRHS